MKEFLQSILGLIISGAISTVLIYINLLIKKLKLKAEKEIEKIDNENAQQLFKSAIERVDILTEKTVAKYEQTVARELRKQIKEGNAVKEDLIKACEGAAFEIYAELKPEYIKILKENYHNTGEYIQAAIEEKLLRLKGELYGNNN